MEHDQQLNGPHMTMESGRCEDKGKIDAFGTLLVDGGGMSPPRI
jgi:hypothetical protein